MVQIEQRAKTIYLHYISCTSSTVTNVELNYKRLPEKRASEVYISLIVFGIKDKK